MEKELKVGDRVVFHDSDKNRANIASGKLCDVTPGRIYTIGRLHPSSGNPQFRDDVGDWDSAAAPDGTGKWTKIVD